MKMALVRIPETVMVPERAYVKSWRLINPEVKHDTNAKLNQREARFNIALLRFLMVIYICADPKFANPCFQVHPSVGSRINIERWRKLPCSIACIQKTMVFEVIVFIGDENCEQYPAI